MKALWVTALVLSAGATAAPAFVQGRCGVFADGGSSVAVTLPASSQAGDMLVVSIGYPKANSLTRLSDGKGSTFTSAQTGGGAVKNIEVFTTTALAGPTTVTATFNQPSGGGDAMLHLFVDEYAELRNVQASMTNSGVSATPTVGPINAPVAGDLIHAFVFDEGASLTNVMSPFVGRSYCNGDSTADAFVVTPGNFSIQYQSSLSSFVGTLLLLSPRDAGPPDAGPPDVGVQDGGSSHRSHLSVGCGCSEAGLWSLGLGAVFSLGLRRRRAHRCSAHSP